MTDSAVPTTRGRKAKTTKTSTQQAPVAQPAKAKTPKKTSPKTDKASSHPKFIEMVNEAIQKLNEKNGSSRQAILKYILATFPVDEKSANQYLKVTLKNGVKAGLLNQSKGVGASGSFKIAEKGAKSTKKSKVAVKKSSVKKETKPTPKKTPSKKAAAKQKAKIVTKEAAQAQLPSSVPKGRKPPTERQPIVAKKTRGKKLTVKPSEPATPAPSPVEKVPSQTAVATSETTKEQKQTSSKGRKAKVSTKKAAEAKSKKATRGRKKEASNTANEAKV